MNTASKILLVGVFAGLGSTGWARDHHGWHGGHGGFRQNRVIIVNPAPIYEYSPYYYPDYSPYVYPYPYYNRRVIIIRGDGHHHHHHR